MLTKKNNNEKLNEQHDVKLTIEEIRKFSDFANEDEHELNEIMEMIYQLSIILYKSNNE